MASEKVEYHLRRMQEVRDYSERRDYIRGIPKNIRARVIGEILDRGNAVDYMEKMHQEVLSGLRRIAEAERRPKNSFDSSGIFNFL